MKKLFEKGGKFEKFYPIYEMLETIVFVKPDRTKIGAHVRDNFDIKRLMAFVLIGGAPAFIFGMYNTGYQHYLSMGTTASTVAYFTKGAFI